MFRLIEQIWIVESAVFEAWRGPELAYYIRMVISSMISNKTSAANGKNMWIKLYLKTVHIKQRENRILKSSIPSYLFSVGHFV